MHSGPPWECRLRRSASSSWFGDASRKRTRSVQEGIPTGTVGTSGMVGSWVPRVEYDPCRNSRRLHGFRRQNPRHPGLPFGLVGPRRADRGRRRARRRLVDRPACPWLGVFDGPRVAPGPLFRKPGRPPRPRTGFVRARTGFARTRAGRPSRPTPPSARADARGPRTTRPPPNSPPRTGTSPPPPASAAPRPTRRGTARAWVAGPVALAVTGRRSVRGRRRRYRAARRSPAGAAARRRARNGGRAWWPSRAGRTRRAGAARVGLVDLRHRVLAEGFEPLDLRLDELEAEDLAVAVVDRVDRRESRSAELVDAQEVERPRRLGLGPRPVLLGSPREQADPGVHQQLDAGRRGPQPPRGDDRLPGQLREGLGRLQVAVLLPRQPGPTPAGRAQLLDVLLTPLDPEAGGDRAVESHPVGGVRSRAGYSATHSARRSTNPGDPAKAASPARPCAWSR